jgi:hypothetical protein
MMSAMPGPAVSAAEGEAKADHLRQAHGRVRPGTKESHSPGRSSSFGDPTKYRQLLQATPPNGQLLGFCWSISYALHSVLRRVPTIG